MYIYRSVILGGGATTSVAASQTNAPISEVVNVTEADSIYFIYAFTVSAIVVGTLVTAKLQHSIDSVNWDDVGAAGNTTLTVTGRTTVNLNVNNNPTLLPLRPKVRLVVTTGAGDSVTVSDVRVSYRPAS